ncbi:MAG: hypothetical protein M3N11_08880, partial [Actinomycetota bacterium]|nr:hypothetical protein [Actinomycetota bacterium]
MTTGASEGTLAWLRRSVWVVLGLGVLALVVRGADGPPDPYLVPPGAEDAGPEETELSAGTAALPEEAGVPAPAATGPAPAEPPGPTAPITRPA